MTDTVDLVFIVANKQSQSVNSDFAGRPMLFPDCTVSIGHRWDNDVTEHPIERGSSVVDHVVCKNATFSISGVFNKYSLSNYTNNVVSSENKVQEAYEYLLALRNNRTPFTLVSKFSSYPDCVVKSLDIPVSPADGDSTLIFSMELQQVRLVESESITLVRATEVKSEFFDTVQTKLSTGKAQIGLAVLEGSPFAPKGVVVTRPQDAVTIIPFAPRVGG
jgi:hypothetical protein